MNLEFYLLLLIVGVVLYFRLVPIDKRKKLYKALSKALEELRRKKE